MENTVFKGESSLTVKYWTIINCQERSCWVLSAKGGKESVGQSGLLRKDGEKHVSPGITPPPWVPRVWSSVGPPAHLRIRSSSRSSSMGRHRSWCQGTRYSNTSSISFKSWMTRRTSTLTVQHHELPVSTPYRGRLLHTTLVPHIASMLVSWTENELKKKRRGAGKLLIVITRAFLFHHHDKVWMETWQSRPSPVQYVQWPRPD